MFLRLFMQIIDFMLLFFKVSSLKTEVTVFLKLRQLPKNLNLKSEQKLDKKQRNVCTFVHGACCNFLCACRVYICAERDLYKCKHHSQTWSRKCNWA